MSTELLVDSCRWHRLRTAKLFCPVVSSSKLVAFTTCRQSLAMWYMHKSNRYTGTTPCRDLYEYCRLEDNPSINRQPVQTCKDWCDVTATASSGHKASCSILWRQLQPAVNCNNPANSTHKHGQVLDDASGRRKCRIGTCEASIWIRIRRPDAIRQWRADSKILNRCACHVCHRTINSTHCSTTNFNRFGIATGIYIEFN